MDRFQTTFSNRYRFSENGNLASSFTGLDSSSELFDSKTYTAAETLTLSHGQNLRSRYALHYDGREERQFSSDTRSAAAGLTHQLYENLATSLDIRVDDTESTSGNIRVDEAILDLDYKRPTRWGSILVDTGYEFRVEDNAIEAVTTDVFDESHVLSGLSPEFLNNLNIDTASIIVTDTTLSFIFQEGIDYLITVFGDSVAIERTLFGTIGDGQEVLVSYSFTPDGPSEFSRTTLRYGADVDIKRTVRLFFNLRQSDENLRSGIRSTRLQNDTQQRMGAEFRWKWNRTLVEYEDRDLTRAPLTRWRAQESLSFRLSNRLSFGGSFALAETDLKDTGDRITDEGLYGDLRWRVSRWGDLEVRVFSRQVRGNSQQTDREGLMTRMVLRYGAWRGSVRLEYLDENDALSGLSRNRSILTMQVKRRFR